jgi:hypothetical protein
MSQFFAYVAECMIEFLGSVLHGMSLVVAAILNAIIWTIRAAMVFAFLYFVGFAVWEGGSAVVTKTLAISGAAQSSVLSEAGQNFMAIPKSYKNSCTETADAFIEGWSNNPDAPTFSDEQRRVLIEEIAPRLNHIVETNGDMAEKMLAVNLPGVLDVLFSVQ